MAEPTITVNPNRIALDEAYLSMAEIWGLRSKANRLQVGALIVKDKQIISDGYNGMPSGADDDVCEYLDAEGKLVTKREVLHAESNALMKISENGGIGAQGATLYTTWSPCFECSKLIKQAKIKRVVYRNHYRDTAGLDMLRQYGVEVVHLHGNAPKVEAPVQPPPPPRPAPSPAAPPNEQFAKLRAAAAPKPPAPVAPPAFVPAPGTPSEAEVEALLRAHEASLAVQSAPQPTKVVEQDQPYRSSFL